MFNMVANKSRYAQIITDTSDKAVYVFEALLEAVQPENTVAEFVVEQDYYAKNLGEFIGGTIPAATLSALANRGLLYKDRELTTKKCVYAITAEIYEYYHNIYKPSREEFINKYCN